MGRTLDDIRASRPRVDRARVEATTEADIHQHAIEDGEDPNASLTGFVKRLPGQRGRGRKPAKVPVSLRLEPDVLAAWKASGPGWQGRVNDLLAREAPKAKQRA